MPTIFRIYVVWLVLVRGNLGGSRGLTRVWRGSGFKVRRFEVNGPGLKRRLHRGDGFRGLKAPGSPEERGNGKGEIRGFLRCAQDRLFDSAARREREQFRSG